MTTKRSPASYARFCDKTGKTILGSDSLIPVNPRWQLDTMDSRAYDKRETYRKHFPHLYASMTHYIYHGRIRVVS